MRTNKHIAGLFWSALVCVVLATTTQSAVAREMKDFPIVRLQSLDKITARTMTFEAHVGETVKFGGLYIKAQACRKTPPIEQPESAAFLQIWEPKDPKAKDNTRESKWVFSGWMFASSPGLSHMDHPIYDVWVLDCLSEEGRKITESDFEEDYSEPRADEGIVAEELVPAQPDEVEVEDQNNNEHE